MRMQWNDKEVLRQAEAAAELGLDILGNKIVKTAQDSIAEPKTGVHYKGMRVPSSAPYEAPAHQWGQLSLRIHMKKDGRLRRLVGTDLDYGLYLEVGTKNMVERPWLRPALHTHTGRVGEEVFEDLMDYSLWGRFKAAARGIPDDF